MKAEVVMVMMVPDSNRIMFNNTKNDRQSHNTHTHTHTHTHCESQKLDISNKKNHEDHSKFQASARKLPEKINCMFTSQQPKRRQKRVVSCVPIMDHRLRCEFVSTSTKGIKGGGGGGRMERGREKREKTKARQGPLAEQRFNV